MLNFKSLVLKIVLVFSILGSSFFQLQADFNDRLVNEGIGWYSLISHGSSAFSRIDSFLRYRSFESLPNALSELLMTVNSYQFLNLKSQNEPINKTLGLLGLGIFGGKALLKVVEDIRTYGIKSFLRGISHNWWWNYRLIDMKNDLLWEVLPLYISYKLFRS